MDGGGLYRCLDGTGTDWADPHAFPAIVVDARLVLLYTLIINSQGNKMSFTKFAAVTLIALSATVAHAGDCYSEGVRVGDVQKFSNKGMINKSWEGELVMEGTKIRGSNGTMTGGNVWKFSVTDAAVAKVIDNAVMSGKPVALRYCQVMIQIGQTDTNYRITQAVERTK